MRPPKKRKNATEKKIGGLMQLLLKGGCRTPATRAKDCSFSSRSRMKASSRGQIISLIPPAARRVQDARDALRPPSAPPRRRGRPTIIARAQAQIARSLAQLPPESPWLASLAPHHLARVAEARRELERKAHRARQRPNF